jgi:hypothetical protein
MPYYSTDSEEHQVNIGEKSDPDLAISIEDIHGYDPWPDEYLDSQLHYQSEHEKEDGDEDLNGPLCEFNTN